MTNKELIEKCRKEADYIIDNVMVDGLSQRDIAKSAYALCERLEAAEKEVEFYKDALNYSRETVSELTLSIERLKGLVRWLREYIEDWHWSHLENCENKAEIDKIVGEG